MVPVDLFLQPELENLPPKTEARLALGLEPDRFTVMFSLGGEGIGRVFEFLRACRLMRCQAQFVVICGRNEELVGKIAKEFPDCPGQPPIVSLGYQANLRVPLAACDVVAGKCGTSSAMETIMLRKPLIVCQPGALNEKDNKDYVVRHGYGWYLPHPLRFARFVSKLADPSSLWGRDRLAFCHHALKRHASKNGALEIAEFLTEQLS
jgi:processive 1,2-diacylglycerol beta-glucosyltransferase